MNYNCSKELTELHAICIKKYIDNRKFVSAISGCEYDAVRKCAASGTYVGVLYHEAIKLAAKNKLGASIGDKRGFSKNGKFLIVGACAEQHAANDVLNELFPDTNKTFDVSLLKFTQTIRPKRKVVIPACENCQLLFS